MSGQHGAGIGNHVRYEMCSFGEWFNVSCNRRIGIEHPRQVGFAVFDVVHDSQFPFSTPALAPEFDDRPAWTLSCPLLESKRYSGIQPLANWVCRYATRTRLSMKVLSRRVPNIVYRSAHQLSDFSGNKCARRFASIPPIVERTQCIHITVRKAVFAWPRKRSISESRTLGISSPKNASSWMSVTFA